MLLPGKLGKYCYLILAHRAPGYYDGVFRIGNAPVCIRCFWRLIGLLLIVSTKIFGHLYYLPEFALSAIICFPPLVAFDWLIRRKHGDGKTIHNFSRVVTGFLLGIAEGLFLVLLIQQNFIYLLFAVMVGLLYLWLFVIYLKRHKITMDEEINAVEHFLNN